MIGELDPARTPYMKNLTNFNLTKFLDPSDAAWWTWLANGMLPMRARAVPRLSEALDPTAATKQKGERDSAVNACEKHDGIERLAGADPRELHRGDALRLMPIRKDPDEDRLVSDRQRRYARDDHLAGYPAVCFTGLDSCDLTVNNDEDVLLFSNDTADMYPSVNIFVLADRLL